MERGENRKPVIVFVGPTGVGKTAVSVCVARRLQTEIISADSRMVYRGMDIGTAKPPLSERGGVPHHLVDVVDPDELYNSGRFKSDATRVLTDLQGRGKIPVVVGGTGLYLRHLFRGLWDGPEADWEIRNRFYHEEKQNPGTLHARLSRVDPPAAVKIPPRDLNRIIRALEVFEITGKPLSEHHREHGYRENRFQSVVIGLRRDREDLYRRIEKRVDKMLKAGLVDEVRGLMKQGYSGSLSSMKGLGYRQTMAYLEGKYGLDEGIRILKRDTKRYAKRQFTWFNRDSEIIWIDLKRLDGLEEAVKKVETVLSKQNIFRAPFTGNPH